MLEIVVPASERFNEITYEFYSTKETVLKLEHSLVSISKWESKWKKPFYSGKQKTSEETRDYIRCMTLTQNVDPEVYYALSVKNMEDIQAYLENSMTATWFNEENNKSGKKGSNEQITSELIYYWMISLQIPFECQKWHINRLFTLIKVCNVKNAPPKKMSKREIMARNKSLNDARRRAMNTTG